MHPCKGSERVGFEPTVEFPLHTLSKRAPSTTRTSLRIFRISGLRAVEHLIIAHASSVALSTSITFRISSFREGAASSLLELCQTVESCRITSSNRRAFVLRGLAPRLISWQRPPQAPSASFAIPLHPCICHSPRRQ